MTGSVQTSERLPGGGAPLAREAVRAFYEKHGVSEHPILELPGPETIADVLSGPPAVQAELVEMLKRRQRRIEKANEDPLAWGFEAETWADADALLKGTYPVGAKEGDPRRMTDECDILGIFGGNRAQKTYYAVRRAIQCVEMFPGTRIALCSEKDTASVTNLQTPLVWPFLKPRYGHLNGKRHTVIKINYTQGNGFTDGKVVLPNGSEIYFLTYNQNPDDYEGWEFGVPAAVYEKMCRDVRKQWGVACETARLAGTLAPPPPFLPPNIGVVADESMTLKWMQMFARRVRFRRAKVLWTFTPVRGITPAVKELVGSSAVTLESRPSELLPRKNLPDVPEGHMPYVRKCSFQRAYAIYFFTQFNKWGPSPGRSYYQEVKDLCAGKESQYVERVAYGFARDSVNRAYKTFGSWNVIKRKHLPAKGTNYFFVDPAGARNWFMMWVRVAAPRWGDGKWTHYIYRDWPDAQTYGEWALATERDVSEEQRKGWDGDPGPAQAGQGFGVTKYKQTILEAEAVLPGWGKIKDAQSAEFQKWEKEADPYHVFLVKRALSRGSYPDGAIQEEIAERYVDPRAGKSEHLAEQGGTCIVDEFADVQVDGNQRVIGPAMDLIPASGVNIDEGIGLVNDLLDWNQEEPLVSLLNQPHLFVCEDCLQVRWMFENYTGRGGESGACKDPADLARYMALARLEDVSGQPYGGREGRGF